MEWGQVWGGQLGSDYHKKLRLYLIGDRSYRWVWGRVVSCAMFSRM